MKAIKTVGFVFGFFLVSTIIMPPILGGMVWLSGGISYSIHRDFEKGWNWAKENVKK